MIHTTGPSDSGPSPSGGKDFGRGRKAGPGGNKKGGRFGDQGDGRNQRKTSLRIGPGRKGRGAELSQRRGSLKKRDRSAEKAMKAEAALERKTVNLPE